MKKFVLLLAIGMGLAACETIIDLDIKFDDKQMAVSAIFRDQRMAGDSTVCVWVSDVLHPLAKNTYKIMLMDAEVHLCENEQFIENLQPVKNYRIIYNWENNRFDTAEIGYFKSHHPLVPGKTYKITANRVGKKEVIHTYTHPPRVIPTSVKLTNPARGEVTITFDNPEGNQQYLISLKSVNVGRDYYFSTLDPNCQIFTLSNFDIFEPEPGTAIVGRYGILYDKSPEARTQQTFVFYIRDFDPDNLQNYQVEFGAVSESFPRYLTSYLAYWYSEDTFFSGREPIFSNAQNGIGVSIGINTGNYQIQP